MNSMMLRRGFVWHNGKEMPYKTWIELLRKQYPDLDFVDTTKVSGLLKYLVVYLTLLFVPHARSMTIIIIIIITDHLSTRLS